MPKSSFPARNSRVMLFAIADIKAHVERILSLLEEENGEQETPEENS